MAAFALPPALKTLIIVFLPMVVGINLVLGFQDYRDQRRLRALFLWAMSGGVAGYYLGWLL